MLNKSFYDATGIQRALFFIFAVKMFLAGVAFAGTDDHWGTGLPVIKVLGWSENRTVFQEKAYVTGFVDGQKITKVTIDEVPALFKQGDRGLFSHIVDLQEGENTIKIEACDARGNRVWKTIGITRKESRAPHFSNRLSVSVLPFEKKAGVVETGSIFQEQLIHALVNRDRFQVIERGKLDAVLKEQRLSSNHIFDQATALKFGRMVSSHTVVTGTISQNQGTVCIIARLVDTETSRVLSTQRVRGKMGTPRLWKRMAEGLALLFHQDFPLLSGSIVAKNGKDIFITLGRAFVKPQRMLIVYRENLITHPKTGKVLGVDGSLIGRARIIEVTHQGARATLVDCDAEMVSLSDKVVSQ
jgi:TolB-like protein